MSCDRVANVAGSFIENGMAMIDSTIMPKSYAICKQSSPIVLILFSMILRLLRGVAGQCDATCMLMADKLSKLLGDDDGHILANGVAIGYSLAVMYW